MPTYTEKYIKADMTQSDTKLHRKFTDLQIKKRERDIKCPLCTHRLNITHKES